tara:strand:+ start:163 stop:339 length:177 start_codon:yes stop_codon:yes gene_type:complete
LPDNDIDDQQCNEGEPCKGSVDYYSLQFTQRNQFVTSITPSSWSAQTHQHESGGGILQ